ncbi:MAG: hypothetical protein WBJ10_12880 [Daejeonella sp.]|uniref:hypothetical protein n=1 Tax=Daejeonella sp. TaxID=2805397 RepID=UPI003C754529
MRQTRLTISFLITILLGVLSAHAQQNAVQGLVIEKSGVSRIANVSVLNKKTGARVFSNELGLFQIAASAGDTLLLSKQGYSDIVKPLLSMTDLVLQMQKVIELQEVRITGQSKKQELDEFREQFQKKGSFYAGKPPLLAYVFQPLTAIYELVGKTPNQARRFNLFYLRELEQTEIDRRFNPSVVSRLTGLTDADLKNFMVTYRPDYENLSRMDEYALINYVNRSLETFNKSGRPKGLLSLPPLPKAPDLTEKNLKY